MVSPVVIGSISTPFYRTVSKSTAGDRNQTGTGGKSHRQ